MTDREPRFQCMFCGLEIDPVGYDPLVLIVRTHYLRSDKQGEEQQLHAHASCLRERAHPSVPLAIVDPDIYEP